MNSFFQKQNNKGAALLLFVIFFLFASSGLTYVISKSIYADIVSFKLLSSSKASYQAALSGNEDIAYRYLNNLTPNTTEEVTIDGITATSTIVYDGVADTYTVTTVANKNNSVRTSEIVLIVSNGVTFNFGMQSGEGGIEMYNSSSIQGNVHSNGSITAAGNTINGDAISAGASGLIDDLVITGSAFANTINDSSILTDAYYQTITNTSVSRNSYPGSSDMATASFPISDEVILGWETEAASSSVYSGPCPYVIDTNTTIGPLKIPCNLTIDKNGTTVTLQGPIWVEGSFDTKSGPTIEIDSSLSDTIVPIIADNPANRVTDSKVVIEQSTNFVGASGVSHVLVISMNEDDEVNGGTEIAIDGGQSGSGDLLLYAPHGRATVGNTGSFTELTAYTIELRNSVTVVFDTGLANPNFQGGPSATFAINSWKEIE